jgi:hypothetical protein
MDEKQEVVASPEATDVKESIIEQPAEEIKETTEPKVIPEADHLKTVAELDTLKKQLAASDRKVRELRENLSVRQENAQLSAQVEYLAKLTDLSAKQYAGNFEGTGNYEQQKQALDAEYATKRSAIEKVASYQAQVQESAEEIQSIFKEAGLDPNDATNTEVVSIYNEWKEAAQQGRPLEKIVAKASKIAVSKVKPDMAKLKEEIRRDVLEEMKRSGALSVDKTAPSGATSAKQDIIKRYAEGDPAVTSEMYKKAIG